MNPMRRSHDHPRKPDRAEAGRVTNFVAVSRCEAKTRRQTAWRGPAMKNGRCRMQGGLSRAAYGRGPRAESPGAVEARACSHEARAIWADSRRRWRELWAFLNDDESLTEDVDRG
jgi:hypothetical protein